MQPLAYFAVRCMLGWLQWVEKGEHAFISNPLVLVAAGAAHCWAVVYALFIAIHTRAMRFEGYHEGYTEHLPFWVSWTENLAIASIFIWWAAGFSTAAVRIIDDDAKALPMDGGGVSKFVDLLRSQRLHEALALAHTLSCIGLFTSIILLCLAMGLMKGSISVCELGLCFVAPMFAAPYTLLAAWRLDKTDQTDAPLGPVIASAAAAAQEAASLGPQLCVILALADSPGHAYLWQNFVYFVTAIAYVAAVAACGHSPPKTGNAALPPQTGESVTCLLLDVVAAIALLVRFPHLNSWHVWALTVILVGLCAALNFKAWRDLMIELLDPLFVVRSDTHLAALPGKERETLRRCSWTCCAVLGVVAMWDIMLHPVPKGFELPSEVIQGVHERLALWDPNTMLLLRWKPGEGRDETALLRAAAESLGTEAQSLKRQALFEEHRLLLFKHEAEATHTKWKTSASSPQGDLAKIIDTSFPAVLNTTLCVHVHAHTELGGESTAFHLPEEFSEIVGPSADAQEAYFAGCKWWTDALDSFQGSAKLESDDKNHASADEGSDLA